MILWSCINYKVYKTKSYRCACYIVQSHKGSVLIDTSVKRERSAILRSIYAMGIQKIDAVFLTHSHTDHAANAAYFSDTFHCPVFVSPKGIQSVRQGRCTMPKGTQPFSHLISLLEPKIPFYDFTGYEACKEAEVLNSDVVKQYLGDDASYLETPGHTSDSVSLILEQSAAIVGDAMVNFLGNQYPPFADDEKGVKASWEKLLSIDNCAWFFPAHGQVVRRNALLKAYQKI